MRFMGQAVAELIFSGNIRLRIADGSQFMNGIAAHGFRGS